ncbi:MAG: type I DNA topoisomerase [Ruminococcaceae bacterium]|nr:type I DNA topoisomerase [Oscillospiraceae bacterium]
MSEKLVIVESPSKATTIKKYLGKGYNVVASMGHVIDLPKSQLAIDVENNFEPRYITIRGKGDLIKSLKKDAKNASKIYLATDPDREGEAISWHLANTLGIDIHSKCRITFNEITKKAVTAAIKEPREIDEKLVDAQQARRVLDRIVGYKISPLLWKKVKKGLSAGRVQSVATKLICDRENEINEFTETEYWTIDAELLKGKKKVNAKFYGISGKKKELSSEGSANEILDSLKNEKFIVSSVKLSKKTKTSPAPFITSSLQQEAGRKLGFTTARTMQAAQQLYEGINIKGKGHIGLITYMRTDSLRLSDDAVSDARNFILNHYGEEYLPKSAKIYKTKKTAQDAHEAIRPSEAQITPDSIKASLSADQYKLYKLIWERFIACQMKDAIYDSLNANIDAGKFTFKASGQSISFDGFTALYTESKDTEEEKISKIVPLEEGEELKCNTVEANQHFTQPPQRYTEASLVKTLEEKGIGRPSTYSPTITTIINRGYIVRNKKNLIPTELGMIVNDLMTEHFENIVDVTFTANMEESLDMVEEGRENWRNIISEFYDPFMKTLEVAEEKIGDIEIKDEESDVVCDKCGAMMVYKHGKFGKFLACPSFPKCRNTKAIVKEIGVGCPDCGAPVIEKKSKRGKIFFGCTNYPDCSFTSWDRPTSEKCPDCGGIMYEKLTRGNKKYCPVCSEKNK